MNYEEFKLHLVLLGYKCIKEETTLPYVIWSHTSLPTVYTVFGTYRNPCRVGPLSDWLASYQEALDIIEIHL